MRPSFLLLPLVFAAAACAPSGAGDDAETSEHADVTDIAKMTGRGDGTFDVECTDGRHEIVSAEDVKQGRVCKPAVFPATPFAGGACTGTPMTEDGARARLGDAAGPVRVGSFVLALRHRTAHFTWDARWQRWSTDSFSWDDAPNDALVAWRDTESESTRGVRAAFGARGAVELARGAGGKPYLRLVGEAANVQGPDTTRFMRLVSEPLEPWTSPGYAVGPSFALEESHGEAGTWSRVTEWGWSVQTRELAPGGSHRSWWFQGNDVTAIVTDRCAQFVSSQTTSGLSPISAAIAIYVAFD